MNSQYRKSNLELLRIVAIIMIIASHYAVHGVQKIAYENVALIEWSSGNTVNKLFTSFLTPGGEFGVALFFVITGYFAINKDKLSFSKTFLITVFYALVSIVVGIFLFAIGCSIPYTDANTTMSLMVKILFTPVTSGSWWYVTAYFVLVLVMPLLNPFIRKLNRNGMFLIFWGGWFFWYCIPFQFSGILLTIQRGLFFYFIGAIIRLVVVQAFENSKKPNLWLLMLFGICWCGFAFCDYYSNVLILGNVHSMVGMVIVKALQIFKSGVTVPIGASTLFLFFNNIHVDSKLINRISRTTFGIYLLHDSPILRPIL